MTIFFQGTNAFGLMRSDSICMYVYIHRPTCVYNVCVCMYVCMYVYVYACMYHMDVHVYILCT